MIQTADSHGPCQGPSWHAAGHWQVPVAAQSDRELHCQWLRLGPLRHCRCGGPAPGRQTARALGAWACRGAEPERALRQATIDRASRSESRTHGHGPSKTARPWAGGPLVAGSSESTGSPGQHGQPPGPVRRPCCPLASSPSGVSSRGRGSISAQQWLSSALRLRLRSGLMVLDSDE